MTQILPLIRRIAENVRVRTGDGRLEKFFIFNFGAKRFVVPAVDVTEVVIPGTLLSIPENSDFVAGVVNVRGTVIPVLNIRERLGLDRNFDLTEDSRMIIFTIKSGVYAAVIADEIEYRLKEGVLTNSLPELADSAEKSFGTALIDDLEYHVFFIDQWLEKNEIEILQKIVESF
ncbi:MAG: hypothetical protein Kow0029_21870 [Candidatus Rifleibacteriota bacterium]